MIIAVPLSHMPVAQSIAQAFDPDIGGSASFDTIRATDTEGNIWAVCHSPCTPEMAQAVEYFKSNPEFLHASVMRDFEIRWADQVPPTLDACEVFCGVIKVAVNVPFAEALPQFNLQLVIPI